jgi:hypothetical protein
MKSKRINRRDFLKITGLLGAEVVLENILGCSPESGINKKFEISVGKDCTIDKVRVKYLGMNSENTFALNASDKGGVPAFYPTSIKEFGLNYQNFRLEKVTPEKIVLTYLGRDKK